MKDILIFSVTLCAGLCLVLAIPVSKEHKPPVHKVIEGDNLLLVCDATPTAEIEIFWLKNDTKSSFRQNGTELKFININRQSAGDYVCYSFNLTAENETEANATVVEVLNVDVLYPAEVTDFSLWPTTLTENGNFTINCKMVGNPDPVWSVMNNRTKVAMMQADMAAGVSLTSWPVGCEDAGFWMCTGHNYLNKNVNTTQGSKVTVYCAPKPRQDSDIQYQVKSRPGMPTYLIMNNYGNPHPSYTWTHNGKIIPRNMHIDGNWFSMVNISNVRVEDFGKYTLRMSNRIGSYVADYEIQPFGGPERPYDLWYSDVTSYSVRLHWTSAYDMGHQQYFRIYKWIGNTFTQVGGLVYDYSGNHGIGDSFEQTITSLEPNTRYKLSVSADNGYGDPAFSLDYVEFTTDYDPWEPSRESYSVTIVVGSAVGGLAFIGLLAFIVYWVKYRHMNTSYETIAGKTIKR